MARQGPGAVTLCSYVTQGQDTAAVLGAPSDQPARQRGRGAGVHGAWGLPGCARRVAGPGCRPGAGCRLVPPGAPCPLPCFLQRSRRDAASTGADAVGTSAHRRNPIS